MHYLFLCLSECDFGKSTLREILHFKTFMEIPQAGEATVQIRRLQNVKPFQVFGILQTFSHLWQWQTLPDHLFSSFYQLPH